MRRSQHLVVAAVAALGAACGGGAAGPPPAAAEAPLTVAVTVAPLAWLVDEVGGGRLRATVMIPPGTSPHAYEPSPREIASLDGAVAFVAVGHPHLAFERQHLEPLLATRPDRPVVRLASAGEVLGEHDPHLWLSPPRMRAAAETLAAALAEVDPDAADAYTANLEATRARIDTVDREVAGLLGDLPRRRFLVVHPAWGAFAEHYGLEQVAIEEHGKEPGPRELARRIDRARADGVGTVFVQQGFAERPAKVIAAEIGAAIVPLDPLARDWDDNLLAVAAALRRELDRPVAGLDRQVAGKEPR